MATVCRQNYLTYIAMLYRLIQKHANALICTGSSALPGPNVIKLLKSVIYDSL
jgi:hypothetical protein